MNTQHTEIIEAIVKEWRDKFTYQQDTGNLELAHFLVNDDGFVEAYSGGITNEVHQHEKWLRATIQAIFQKQEEQV